MEKHAITGTVCFIIGGLVGYFIHKPKTVIPPKDNTITIIKHKRDSVLLTTIKNDTIIKEIEKEYEKTRDSLLTLPPNEQCNVFSGYLSKNAWRLSCSDNVRSNEDK